MAAEPPTETTDRPMTASYEEPPLAQEHEMLAGKSPILHTHAHAVAGRVRERRLSSSSHPAASEVGAPCVWTTPDWAAHPVIENYYGHARRARVNSFYEVMQSPTNTLATRTLAENCNSYGSQEEEEEEDNPEEEEEEEEGRRRGENGARPRRAGVKRAILTQPTRKLGSFSYSYTTETSDEVVSASPSFSTSTADSGYEARRVHVGDTKMAAVGGRPVRNDSTGSNHRGGGGGGGGGGGYAKKGGGYAHWNRRRLQSDATTEMVPTPHPNGRMKKPAQDAVQSMTRQHHHQEELLYENPQGGHLRVERSPSASSSADSPLESPLLRPRASLTSGRLKSKLQECLLQIDDRIDVEAAMARDAYACIARSTKESAVTKRESLMWSLLCGARTATSRSRGSASFDGIEFLQERLSVALHHRALNQLHRHRRHVNGILQIVTSHNPDLNLTEKQLDSFESADATLANDIKYAMLQRQVEALSTTSKKRLDALRHAKIKNGRDCFESARVKSAMLAKLLEAVSWYRLVQTNSREESASTSVGLSMEASAAEATAAASGDGDGVAHQQQEQHESSLSSGSSGSSSSISASRSLQELQVERILSVLAGEEFYSDYNELMCQPDWWEIAQAHFENIIFSKAESRVCQWVNRVSKEVAVVCHEALEEENSYRLGEKHSKTESSMAAAAAQPPAEWTRDPQPEQILEFIDRLTRRIRKEFDVPSEVTKSLNAFVQRMVFPRLALLCFNQKTMIDCQRKDKLWRKRCVDLSGIPLENLGVVSDLACKIRSKLPSRRVSGGRKSFLIRAIDAFNCLTSVVPCDLLDELMYGVVILHHEAALVLGTTQFSVETFFPLLTYVLLHCQLPTIHAQLHLLENYAINNSNLNGEESYYVYCVHAAVEYVCNSAGPTLPSVAKPKEEPADVGQDATGFPVDPLSEQKREAVAVPVASV